MKIASLLVAAALVSSLLACTSAARSSQKSSKHAADKEQAQELIQTEVLVAERPANRKKKGGGSSSIGTDAYDVKTKTAWFYGSRPIVTCFNHVESFGPSADEVTKIVTRAIKNWRDYFVRKKIGAKAGELSPNANFKFTGRCKGNEDLVFFFGTGPIFGGLDDLKAVQKLNFPVAYVNKTHMTRDLKWSKGYIRFVPNGYYESGEKPFPNWGRPGGLESILAHEIGHVLGFSHTPGTIMKSELVDEVVSEETRPPSLEIDGARELVSCVQCQRKLRIDDKTMNAKFFTSLGLKPGSDLTLLASESGFSVADGTVKLPIVQTSRTDLVKERTLWSNFDVPLNDTSEAFNIYGSVAAKGRKIPVIVEYNSGHQGGVVLRSEQDGEILEVGRFREE